MSSIAGSDSSAIERVDEAVIRDARRRQRRRRLVLVAVAVIAVATAVGIGAWRSHGGGSPQKNVSHVNRAQATRCLTSRGALVARAPAIRDFPRAPAIHVSFALVPGQRTDGATISFQRDHATAERAVADTIRRFQSRAPSIRRLFVVVKNAIVTWDAPSRSTASQTAVVACL